MARLPHICSRAPRACSLSTPASTHRRRRRRDLGAGAASYELRRSTEQQERSVAAAAQHGRVVCRWGLGGGGAAALPWPGAGASYWTGPVVSIGMVMPGSGPDVAKRALGCAFSRNGTGDICSVACSATRRWGARQKPINVARWQAVGSG
jgi:hypothetical protein